MGYGPFCGLRVWRRRSNHWPCCLSMFNPRPPHGLRGLTALDQGRRQREGQWCQPPHLKSVPPHFTFGPPVAAYIQHCILKIWPPLLVFGPSFWFLPPLLLHPGDRPALDDETFNWLLITCPRYSAAKQWTKRTVSNDNDDEVECACVLLIFPSKPTSLCSFYMCWIK